ncbi:MAG TPA: hypothetical protein VK509_23205 [Polyangiales bacterium]|nr:hypothetical protein [Polyangiales bacterium]
MAVALSGMSLSGCAGESAKDTDGDNAPVVGSSGAGGSAGMSAAMNGGAGSVARPVAGSAAPSGAAGAAGMSGAGTGGSASSAGTTGGTSRPAGEGGASGGAGASGEGGTSGKSDAGAGAGGEPDMAGTMAPPTADYAPSPDNPAECPAVAPENPVGDCLGMPIYLVCEYGDDSFWYVCTCDWYHWLCAGT